MRVRLFIREDYRQGIDYFQDKGKNQSTRLVDIFDPDASTIEEAFLNMFKVNRGTLSPKPLMHVIITPHKTERFSDKMLKSFFSRLERSFGMDPSKHQYIIIEHIKRGSQHFHVMLNRVDLGTGKSIDAGLAWTKSLILCSQFEHENGLKPYYPDQPWLKDVALDSPPAVLKQVARKSRYQKGPAYQKLAKAEKHKGIGSLGGSGGGASFIPTGFKPPEIKKPAVVTAPVSRPLSAPVKKLAGEPGYLSEAWTSPGVGPLRPGAEREELLAWAWEQKRRDILSTLGVHLPDDYIF